MNKSLVVCGLLFSLTASAADESRAARMDNELKARFTKADVNGDGKLTRDEAKGKMPRVYANFDKIDVNHVGYLTVEDIENFVQDKIAAKQSSTQ